MDQLLPRSRPSAAAGAKITHWGPICVSASQSGRIFFLEHLFLLVAGFILVGVRFGFFFPGRSVRARSAAMAEPPALGPPPLAAPHGSATRPALLLLLACWLLLPWEFFPPSGMITDFKKNVI